MPTSEFSNIGPIMNEIGVLNPSGVMDLGVGVGKYGMLCREMLDGRHGRVHPRDWEALICGIEGFEAYRNPTWELYTRVKVADILTEYDKVKGWPLVLMIDSLEHFDEPTAKVLLSTLVANNKHVIVSVPLGNCPQGECFGNVLETHRSTWNGPGDFKDFKHRILHKDVCLVVSITGEHQDTLDTKELYKEFVWRKK